MKNKEKIVISGLGAISALGSNCMETLDGFKNAKRNARKADLFETGLDKIAFQVDKIPERWGDCSSRTLALVMTAVEEALGNANVDKNSSLRIGVCLGTTVASQFNDMDYYRRYRKDGHAPMDAVAKHLNGNLAEAVQNYYGFDGPSLSVVNACSSGTDTIGIGMSWINAGLCDLVIAGGGDELNLVSLAGFSALNVYSDKLCAPFDRDRSGLNLGEAAGIMIIEKESSARSRNADFKLECLGYGTYADAYHITAPRPDGSGLEKAINKAVADAGIKLDEIEFVNAHGTATKNNDLVEGSTLTRIFGKDMLIYSTKGYTGHTLGAAGGLEAVFVALAMENGWVAPSIGFENVDEELDFSPIKEITDLRGRYALSTSLAFGGLNSALVIGKVL